MSITVTVTVLSTCRIVNAPGLRDKNPFTRWTNIDTVAILDLNSLCGVVGIDSHWTINHFRPTVIVVHVSRKLTLKRWICCRKHKKYITIFFKQLANVYSWNLSLWAAMVLSYNIFNTIVAVNLAMQGATASAAMVLIWLSRNIPVSAWEGLMIACQIRLMALHSHVLNTLYEVHDYITTNLARFFPID